MTDPTALRLALYARGYRPVPVTGPDANVPSAGKRPVMQKWQTRCLDASPEDIVKWGKAEPRSTNTGLLTGLLSGIDIDVLDATLAAAIEARAVEVLGPTPLRRIGRAPKVLLAYRLTIPLDKVQTAALHFTDDPTEKPTKVEVLGRGQQFVAFGIHPETRQPYAWPGASPLDTDLADVPEVTEGALRTFLAEAEEMLRETGAATRADRKRTEAKRETEGRRAAGLKSEAPPDRATIAEALDAIRNDLDYDGWVRIGFALYDGLGPAGQDLWEAWSATSPRNDPALTARKWPTFAQGRTVGIATLFWHAVQNGWRRRAEHGGRGGPRRGRPHGQGYAPGAAPSAEGGALGADPRRNGGPGLDEVVTEDSATIEFAGRYAGRLRFCHDHKAWFEWTGAAWRQNRIGLAFRWARELARDLAEPYGDEPKVRAVLGRTTFAAGVEKFARADAAFAVTHETWDADLWLLGTPGGTVDLRTGELREPDPEDGITKLTAVAPADAPDCPLWLDFLDQATKGDAQMIRLLRQLAGIALTGVTREHILPFAFGGGGNGKGVMVNTLAHVMGDYAVVAAMDTFMASQGDKHSTDLAMLRGARLVTASETEEGRSWAESRIKQMTGGDPITARFMRADNFTYVPQFLLLIMGNNKPNLNNVDDAMRRRFIMLPFENKPERPDPDLPERLKAEWPAILRWAIEGCLDWQMNGLVRSERDRAATEEYFANQDSFGQWLTEDCDCEPGNEYKTGGSTELFNAWSAFARCVGDNPGTIKSFPERMEKRGFVKVHRKVGKIWLGIRLKPRAHFQEAAE